MLFLGVLFFGDAVKLPGGMTLFAEVITTNNEIVVVEEGPGVENSNRLKMVGLDGTLLKVIEVPGAKHIGLRSLNYLEQEHLLSMEVAWAEGGHDFVFLDLRTHDILKHLSKDRISDPERGETLHVLRDGRRFISYWRIGHSSLMEVELVRSAEGVSIEPVSEQVSAPVPVRFMGGNGVISNGGSLYQFDGAGFERIRPKLLNHDFKSQMKRLFAYGEDLMVVYMSWEDRDSPFGTWTMNVQRITYEGKRVGPRLWFYHSNFLGMVDDEFLFSVPPYQIGDSRSLVDSALFNVDPHTLVRGRFDELLRYKGFSMLR